MYHSKNHSCRASENALSPNKLIASHFQAFGLGNGPGVVCVVASRRERRSLDPLEFPAGGFGGKVTDDISIHIWIPWLVDQGVTSEGGGSA